MEEHAPVWGTLTDAHVYLATLDPIVTSMLMSAIHGDMEIRVVTEDVWTLTVDTSKS